MDFLGYCYIAIAFICGVLIANFVSSKRVKSYKKIATDWQQKAMGYMIKADKTLHLCKVLFHQVKIMKFKVETKQICDEFLVDTQKQIIKIDAEISELSK
jgi:hypothetical protein